MERVSKVLWKGLGGWLFMCPGCDAPHSIPSKEYNPDNRSATWTFNGDVERPSFHPSVLVTAPGHDELRCHSFITDGQIQFLNDCGHKLAGQTVPLGDPADWFGEDV